MADDDLKRADILKDPLIRQMMRADRVSLREMRKLLQDAARSHRLHGKDEPLRPQEALPLTAPRR
ncbi:hypothetical protein [Mesorhizobium delmotii]|uniref:Uncharacterized protein n=1 Tax=Mesorhizobium delmotii TaxID=1631247 RepID=A0A2P9AD72_9HYPH|nr:hypothetical protein [Mesorhizobium delmotii]SJM29089.1 hypothetical protein BQ8482_111019 [Mesorhizobium delmotii]